MNGARDSVLPGPANGAVQAAVARAQQAARALEAALIELCGLGAHVEVRVDPGYAEGATSPSRFFIELDVSPARAPD
ncbi:hypothetical protein [Muricoccus radiodurans]|uniref:hypothetical protein n=1 Tax=Muricoccus radiodurans TaxID=2231721 RepID=UPI003CED6725